MTRLWAAALAAGLAAGGTRAADPPAELALPPDQLAKARDLVRLLGSPSYPTREEATAELGKMGRTARAALADAVATSPDHEVRARAARLLPRAEAADLQARIAAFAADTAGRFRHDLPGWDRFRDLAGNDPAGRGLYAEMLRGAENREVLAAVAAGPREGGAAVANRRLGLFLAQNPGAFGGRMGGVPASKQPALADIATVLFAEGVVPAADIPKGGPFIQITGAHFAQQPAAVNAANTPAGDPHGEPFRRLFLRWLDTRTAPEDLAQVVNVAQQLRPGVRDVTPLLRRVVTTAGVQGHARSQALVALVQRNKAAEHPFLKSQLTNETPVMTVFLGLNPAGGQAQAACQVRDVALAILVADTGQSIFDYGYETAQGNVVNPVANPFPTYAFTSDEARAHALRRWAAWESKNPLPGPPLPQAPPPRPR